MITKGSTEEMSRKFARNMKENGKQCLMECEEKSKMNRLPQFYFNMKI